MPQRSSLWNQIQTIHQSLWRGCSEERGAKWHPSPTTESITVTATDDIEITVSKQPLRAGRSLCTNRRDTAAAACTRVISGWCLVMDTTRRPNEKTSFWNVLSSAVSVIFGRIGHTYILSIHTLTSYHVSVGRAGLTEGNHNRHVYQFQAARVIIIPWTCLGWQRCDITIGPGCDLTSWSAALLRDCCRVSYITYRLSKE